MSFWSPEGTTVPNRNSRGGIYRSKEKETRACLYDGACPKGHANTTGETLTGIRRYLKTITRIRDRGKCMDRV